MGQNDQDVDVSRRDLGTILGLLGGTAGLAALAACSENAGASPSSPEQHGSTAEALTGPFFIWVDTINGPGADGGIGAPTLRGVMGSDTSSSSLPAAVVGGYAAPGDGGGGVFYWDTNELCRRSNHFTGHLLELEYLAQHYCEHEFGRH